MPYWNPEDPRSAQENWRAAVAEKNKQRQIAETSAQAQAVQNKIKLMEKQAELEERAKIQEAMRNPEVQRQMQIQDAALRQKYGPNVDLDYFGGGANYQKELVSRALAALQPKQEERELFARDIERIKALSPENVERLRGEAQRYGSDIMLKGMEMQHGPKGTERYKADIQYGPGGSEDRRLEALERINKFQHGPEGVEWHKTERLYGPEGVERQKIPAQMLNELAKEQQKQQGTLYDIATDIYRVRTGGLKNNPAYTFKNALDEARAAIAPQQPPPPTSKYLIETDQTPAQKARNSAEVERIARRYFGPSSTEHTPIEAPQPQVTINPLRLTEAPQPQVTINPLRLINDKRFGDKSKPLGIYR